MKVPLKGNRFLKVFVFLLLSSFLFSNVKSYILGQSPNEQLQKLQDQITQYENEIIRLKNQSVTLANQISQYDLQIKLTVLKISETQGKIDILAGRINQLEVSLSELSLAFSERAEETYKLARLNQSFLFLFSASDIKETVNRFFYLKKIQAADRDLLVRLQTAQTNYKGEKEDQEQLQTQLEAQKKNLDTQKKAKANLLELTKNDEKRFQQLLAQARAEYEAIQAILAGKGEETESGKVSQGQKIASIIQGASCNSSGSHLHFMVAQNGNANNPFSYLKNGIDIENCSGSSCGSGDGDTFNLSGSWDWPISPKIKLMQGFGNTWAVKNTWVGRIYSFHNGIDIDSDNSEVKAVKSGTLYQGSYAVGSGCRLRYVRVDHDDSDLETFYLHINY